MRISLSLLESAIGHYGRLNNEHLDIVDKHITTETFKMINILDLLLV
jgi:hypothetical protein